MRHAHATMGDAREHAPRRFAPINQEGDYIDLDCIDNGQYVDIAILRSLTIHLEYVVNG